MNGKDGAEEALNLNGNPGNPVNKTKTTIKRIFSEKRINIAAAHSSHPWMDKVGVLKINWKSFWQLIRITNFYLYLLYLKYQKYLEFVILFIRRFVCSIVGFYICCISSLPVLSFDTIYRVCWIYVWRTRKSGR